MHWKRKAAVFRLLSVTPFGSQLHYQLQRRVTREWPRRAEALDELVDAAKRIREHSSGAERYLEIGAGRDLAMALALRMLGAKSITCLDVTRLARLDLIRHAARHIARRLGISPPPPQEFASWSVLEKFGIAYRAPSYVENLEPNLHQFDCFCSVDTLEHVPPTQITSLARHARRLLVPNGCAVHLIDYGDHFARGDELSRFNFLTFDEQAWRPYQSRFQYVNRLRHSQMLAIWREAGFEVVYDEPTRAPSEQAILAQLADQFRALPPEDLFTLRALVELRPTPG